MLPIVQQNRAVLPLHGKACTKVIMRLFGLEHAIVWTILIFFLNYIPRFGLVVAAIFPAVTAVLQFSSWLQIALLVIVLAGVQTYINSYWEPKLMGDRLNVSPFVVVVALVFFGVIWGIAGLILSIPLVITLVVVLAHFPTTRPLAVLLSADGVISGMLTIENLAQQQN